MSNCRQAFFVLARTTRASVVAFLLGTVGCADFSSVTDPTFGLPDDIVAAPSFSTDIQPIFDRRCSIGGCHSLATAQGGLTLAASASYAALVGVPSSLRPQFDRVEPFDPANSWLVRMIGPDPALRLGHQRMPLSSVPLTPNQIQTIVNWIEQGAPRN
jgi:hypothetical protein